MIFFEKTSSYFAFSRQILCKDGFAVPPHCSPAWDENSWKIDLAASWNFASDFDQA
jgi:hypothetical protein